ncbi:MAG: hypothetical protein AMJ88_12855 [Anaerolineae bacterium SM23_ 63]|nr:MAG: hypothetical protein AMJ88_12855 [Anaerolineae bacterium SM23_ 63]HEY45408.1 hypothetical protein [Anaerolineae bacterium]
MNWQDILTFVLISIFMSGMISLFIRNEWVKKAGKHMYDQSLTRGYSFGHYSLDQETHQRINRGTLVFFVLLTVILIVVFWYLISSYYQT